MWKCAFKLKYLVIKLRWNNTTMWKKHNITFTHDNFKAQCFHQPNQHSFGTRKWDIFDVSQTTLNGPPANLESRIGTGEEFYRTSLSLHEWDSICHWEQSRYKLDTLLFDSRMSHEKPPTEFEEQVFAWRYFNSGENNWCLQNCKLTSFFSFCNRIWKRRVELILWKLRTV